MEKYHPVDATTNPTLLLKFLQTEEGKRLVGNVISGKQATIIGDIIKFISVDLGSEILGRIKGRVSTEVDPRYF